MNNVAITNFLMASTVSPFILELHILSYLVVKLHQLSCEQISPVQVTVSLLKVSLCIVTQSFKRVFLIL